MNQNSQVRTKSHCWTNQQRHAAAHSDALLRVVDAGLCGVICVAPFFFGGRHDSGRLLLVSLIGVTATAWFVRQARMPGARWNRTFAHWIWLSAVGLLLLQLIPLPLSWIEALSPRTIQLLPLWSSDGGAVGLGSWTTLSLMPHETTKSLAMMVSYGLLFTVVVDRVQNGADVRRLLRMVAVASVLMAAFGLLQYFTSDGRFYWFYDHPYRDARRHLCGSFINRNHFASFLVLGVGPLAYWLWQLIETSRGAAMQRGAGYSLRQRVAMWLVAAALILVVCSVLGSLSRGGAAALLVAAAVVVAIGWSRQIVDSRLAFGLAVLVVVVVGLLSVYGYDQVAERLDDFAQGSIDAMDQNEGRRRVWTANEGAIEAGWLVGSGAGSHAEICPVYLNESPTVEFTHAESGYLQVATENGIVGEVLLLAGIGLCGWWCVGCYHRALSPGDALLFAACAAGLAASIVHSVVDFVWYIPACMSVTIVLAACVLRLAQLTAASDKQSRRAWQVDWSRAKWTTAAAVVLFASAWAIDTYVGPGIAAIHWNRYLRASVANRESAGGQFAGRGADQPQNSSATAEQMSDAMLRHLERVLAWEPQFARAQLRLAAAYVARFEMEQLRGENAMTLPQIQDAAIASRFATSDDLQMWLNRACGASAELLYRADTAARRAVANCPLQGEGYVLLGELSFVHGGTRETIDACFDQALRVRPHDGDVLYEIGEQRLLSGQLTAALDIWQRCFANCGPHQLKIVYLLAGRIPAPMFLEKYSPDWGTLSAIWARYRLLGQPEDLEPLLAYSAAAAESEMADADRTRATWIWYSLGGMYADVTRQDESLACLEQAYACDPRNINVRLALADAFLKAGRFDDAESHVRWCLARRPEQKSLRAALVQISKQKQHVAARRVIDRSVRRASYQTNEAIHEARP